MNLSHWSANPDHFKIYLSFCSAKNNVIFYVSITLFSGLSQNYWAQLIHMFRRTVITTDTPEVAVASGSTAASRSMVATCSANFVEELETNRLYSVNLSNIY